MVDAYEHALIVPVTFKDDSLTVRVASLAAIVILKIVALHDRPEDRKHRDSADIAFIIRNYLNTGAGQRFGGQVYGDVMRKGDDDLLLVAAHVLGMDMGLLVSSPARDLVIDMLKNEASSRSRCPLTHRLSEEIGQGSFARARRIVVGMLEGMERALSAT